MKVTAGFLLLCMAAAVSASSDKHRPNPVSDGQNYPGRGRWPGQRIGTAADETASRGFASIDNGSQYGRSSFSDAGALRDDQYQQYDPDNPSQTDKDEISEIRNRDNGNLPPVGVPRNMGGRKSVEPVPSAGQQAALPLGQDLHDDLRRSYRSGNRRRSSSEYESPSSEETGQQNGRSLRRQPRRDDGRRNSEEERPWQDRLRRQRYADDYDSHSSEENRRRGGRTRPYSRRGDEDNSREDGRRRYGRGRTTGFEGFD